MKRRLIIIIFSTGIFLIAAVAARNHIRLLLMRNNPSVISKTKIIRNIDESIFTIEVYECKRNFNNKILNFYNSFYDDKILLVRVPLKNFKFRNLTFKPIGNDQISKNADLYFNTLFFDRNYIATTGIIVDKNNINNKRPVEKRIGIDEKGRLNSFSSKNNSIYNDVLQAPFSFRINSKIKSNFRTLDYRQFVSIENETLIYISGYKNSLISWSDIKSIMQLNKLSSIIALDGGASMEYYFKGRNNTYSFSSIPFRHLWFPINSPYYIEAKIKSN